MTYKKSYHSCIESCYRRQQPQRLLFSRREAQGGAQVPRISCVDWLRLRTSCGLPYWKPHTQLLDRAAYSKPETADLSTSVLMNKCCLPIKNDYGLSKRTKLEGLRRPINPGTQTREPGAPLQSGDNVIGSFGSFLR